MNSKVIYHAGDTECIPEMQNLGLIDIALLPIGDKFTMSIDEAVEAAKMRNPKIVIPMHNHNSSPDEFKAKLEAKTNITAVPLRLGEMYQLK